MKAAEYVAAHGGYFIFWVLFWLAAAGFGHYEVGRIVRALRG